MKTLTLNDYQKCFPSWKSSWNRCINTKADYFDGGEVIQISVSGKARTEEFRDLWVARRIYHKMQCMFIYRYSQVVSVVSSCQGRCPICKRFCPKSYESCPHLWSQPLLLSVPVVLLNLQEGGGNKNLVSNLPTHRKFQGC